MSRIQHVLYVEKKCKYSKVLNVFLVNMYFIKIVCVHGFNDNKLVCFFKRRFLSIENIDITGPICRTTVLRPTPPRTVPPQPQAHVPSAEVNPPATSPPPPSASSAPVDTTTTQTSPLNINVGTFPMLLPPFGKLDKKKIFR